MSLPELFVIAVGLSMDAFAVAICKGMSIQKLTLKNAAVIGVWFGSFQALMPLAGYLLGVNFRQAITAYDHWIAFILLGIIGINMIKEALNNEEESCDASVAAGDLFILAIATSIDALAAGVTFAFLQVNICPAVFFIGCITFVLSMTGARIGAVFGCRCKSKAEFAGGMILMLMGIKLLIEHL